MKFTKHKKNIETFFQERLPFLYQFSYVKKRLENNSQAFTYSFKLLQEIFVLGKGHYKFILAGLYVVGMVWQAYMISDIVPFSEGFYYIGLEYSTVLLIKILTILLLTIGVCFMTVWGMFFLPFVLACVIPALLIGNALFEYRHFLNPYLVPAITALYVICINIYYYKIAPEKHIQIKAGMIIFYIFAGLFFTVLNTGVLEKKESEASIELREGITIDGKIHFYNGAKYFVSYVDDDSGKTIKKIINGISTISVEYK